MQCAQGMGIFWGDIAISFSYLFFCFSSSSLSTSNFIKKEVCHVIIVRSFVRWNPRRFFCDPSQTRKFHTHVRMVVRGVAQFNKDQVQGAPICEIKTVSVTTCIVSKICVALLIPLDTRRLTYSIQPFFKEYSCKKLSKGPLLDQTQPLPLMCGSISLVRARFNAHRMGVDSVF